MLGRIKHKTVKKFRVNLMEKPEENRHKNKESRGPLDGFLEAFIALPRCWKFVSDSLPGYNDFKTSWTPLTRLRRTDLCELSPLTKREKYMGREGVREQWGTEGNLGILYFVLC